MSAEESQAIDLAEEINISARLTDLEQNYAELERDRKNWIVKATESKEQLQELQKEKETYHSTLCILKDELSAVKSELAKEKSSKVEAETIANNLREKACRVEAEADDLREEISRLTESNRHLNQELSSIDMKRQLADVSSVPLQYETERLRKEVDAFSAHSKWLEEENSRYSRDLSILRINHAQTVTKLREDLNQAIVEKDTCHSELRVVLMTKEDLEKKVEQLSRDLFESRNETTTANEAFEKELIAERRLVQMQKEQLDRMVNRSERLEKELENLREVAANASVETERELDKIRKKVQREADIVLKNQQEAFEKAIEEYKVVTKTPESKDSPLKSVKLLTYADTNEPMGLTELYARLNATEDDLRNARAECEKLRRYVHRIEAEIASKTPQMLRQRKEYELAIERQEEMHARLRDALKETKLHQEEATEFREELFRMQRRHDELQTENKALAKHVQALLASKAGADIPEGIPTSISEIQEQNQQLMGEHRRLLTKIEELQNKLYNDRTTARLQKAEEELERLNEERLRQEKIVATIVQQRDLYRALVCNQESGPIDLTSTELTLSQHSKDAQSAIERCNVLDQDLAKARADLAVCKGDKEAMLQKIDLYATHANELTVSMEKIQNELSTANANVARSKAESDYYRDKCIRVEEKLEEFREELNRHSEVKAEIQGLNMKLQNQIAEANLKVCTYENDLRQIEMKLRLAKAQEETAKASEARFSEELSRLRSEIGRQGSLSDTIQRIESRLLARNEEEKEKLLEESARWKQLFENERTKLEIEKETMQSQIKDLEMANADLHKKKEEAIAESIAAKKEVILVTTQSQKLVLKTEDLEKELSALKEKVLPQGFNELQKKCESLTNDLASSKSEVLTFMERASNFERLAKESEAHLISLSKASDEYKNAKLEECQQLETRILTLTQDITNKDAVIASLTRDLCGLRGEYETDEAILKSKIQNLEEQVKITDKSAQDARMIASDLVDEVAACREETIKFKGNYERELELHAATAKELRNTREELDSEQQLRRSAENTLQNALTEISEKQKLLTIEKENFLTNIKEMEENLSITREQNNLLLSQLTSLGDQVEKSQADRIEVTAGDAMSCEEIETLRKQVSELREIVKFMRSEREMNEAKIDAAQRTAERERAALAVTKRSLDEARAELKILNEMSRHPDTSVDLEKKLQEVSQQTNVLQESNTLLRNESLALQESLTSQAAEFEAQKKAVIVLEHELKDITIEKAALSADAESLRRELSTWKSRVKDLVSRFNQIDPNEHASLLKQVETLQTEIKEIKSQKEVAEKDGINAKAIVTKLNKELAIQKALVQKQVALVKRAQAEKDSNTLTSNSAAILTKENTALKEKIQKMDSESKSQQTELQGANDRIDMLKNRMRQFQKTIGEQAKRISDLEIAVNSSNASQNESKVPNTKSKSTITQKSNLNSKPLESIQETEKETPLDSEISETLRESENIVSNGEEMLAENLPCVPIGGFHFGPGSVLTSSKKEEMQTNSSAGTSETRSAQTEITAVTVSAPLSKKDDVQKRPSPAEGTTPEVHDSIAPPSKRAKMVVANLDDQKNFEDSGNISAENKSNLDSVDKSDLIKIEDERIAIETSVVALVSTEGGDQTKLEAEGVAPLPKKPKLTIQEQNHETKVELEGSQVANTSSHASKADDKVKATQSLKDQLKQKREALAQRKKKLEEAAAKQKQAEKSSSQETLEASNVLSVDENVEVVQTGPETVSKSKVLEDSIAADTRSIDSAIEYGNDKVVVQEDALNLNSEKSDTPKPLSFANSPFGVSTFAGISKSSFGLSSVTKPLPFGSVTSIGLPGAFLSDRSSTKEDSEVKSSVFLDIKPPSSSAAPFSFGSSTITLPTPSIVAPPSFSSPFNAFGGTNSFNSTSTPFGSSYSSNPVSLPLFGKALSTKEESKEPTSTEESLSEDIEGHKKDSVQET